MSSRSAMQSRARRGAHAVEFALVLPVLMTFVLGVMDFGWYYMQQAQITNALREAARSGSLQLPDAADDPGECSTCISQATARAIADLDTIGFEIDSTHLNVSMQSVSGTCALVFEPDIQYSPLAGYVPTPDHFSIRVVSLALNVEGC